MAGKVCKKEREEFEKAFDKCTKLGNEFTAHWEDYAGKWQRVKEMCEFCHIDPNEDCARQCGEWLGETFVDQAELFLEQGLAMNACERRDELWEGLMDCLCRH